MKFSVLKATAWSPTRQDEQDWQDWASSSDDGEDRALSAVDAQKPKTAQIPAMTRRRLTLWGAMAIEVACQCRDEISENTPTIFASRHGDTHRTLELLKNIAAGEALSPTAFSLSVHNSSSGMFSIEQKLYANAVAIAAGKDTLGHSLIEAHNLLSQGHEKVLLAFCDLPLAEFYQPYNDELEQPHALCFVLARAEKAKTQLQLSYTATEACAPDRQSQASNSLSMSLQFLRFWYSRQTRFLYAGKRLTWELRRL